jgi:spore maturation protein CgeB
MTYRDTLLIAHGSMHPALRRELVARGLFLRESRSWQEADPSEPDRLLGAYTWFYEGLRHPLTIWGMRNWTRRHGIPLFTWNQDAPHYLNRASWRLDLLDHFRLYDIYASHSLVDSRRFADTVLYLPNAADTAQYKPSGFSLEALRDNSTYQYDVSFFGAMEGVRYKELQVRQEFFAALGDRLRQRGIRYLFRESAGMSIAEQLELIHGSRINLNFGAACDHGSPIASGLPERCYGIPAAGGFLLCDRRTHARDDFTPNENWAEFDGLEDCVEKICFWLDNFGQARALAERCHHHVLSQHTYKNRAAKLLDTLLSWHKGMRGDTS